jgi:broad specificity phosphatase PhoE
VAYAASPLETVVHLIRHGKVENPSNVRYGHAPGFRLSGRGRAQAKAAGVRLRELGAPLAALVSSPLERAVETAEIIADEVGMAITATDERVTEAGNQLAGLHRYAFLHPRQWHRLYNPFKPSWGEPFEDIAARMRGVIGDLRERHRGAATAIVSHQACVWIAREAYEHPGRVPWLGAVRCTQASITSLRFEGDRYLGHWYWAPPL